ncbi:phage tail assembly protein [Grimontia hollisae]|uniref:phage tail assembly protein n=1 Tax=Grimontia hollisae TaxID=673 RepID=UPI001303A5B5|nr:phage tail assembly protein [Grimontia hollisae]
MQKVSTLPFFKRGHSNEVVIKPITVGAFYKLPHIKKDDMNDAEQFAQYKAAIFECTDLSDEEFAALTAPDFNQLSRDIASFIHQPSDLLRGEPLDGETFSFELLYPFTNELGEELKTVRFTVPTVAHSEALAEKTEDNEREAFMFQSVTALHKNDVDRMALNDYLAIKSQVGAFFTQLGAFFAPKMWTA